MRRPRAGYADLHSGGPGTRSGGITTPPRGARWTGTVPPVSDGPRCDKPMRRTGTKALRRNRDGNQETRTWGSEIAAVECREAPASFKRGCGKTEDWCATRCSIPSHVEGQEKGPANGAGRTAYPGPPRIRAILRARFTLPLQGRVKILASGGGIRKNRVLRWPLLFGYIRALSRSG